MLSPSSAQRPDRTRNPRSAARVASSATSRVFPTPASPLISAWDGRPSLASSSRPSRRVSSPSLPTSRPLDARSTLQVSQHPPAASQTETHLLPFCGFPCRAGPVWRLRGRVGGPPALIPAPAGGPGCWPPCLRRSRPHWWRPLCSALVNRSVPPCPPGLNPPARGLDQPTPP